MTTDAGSTVPRRQIGRLLKQARERAGISVEAAARAIEWHKQKLYRVERGETALRAVDVRAMCSLYGVETKTTEAYVALASQTKEKGWWQSYGDVIPEWFDLYLGMEAAASRLRHLEVGLVPGLLQTRAYARAIISGFGGLTNEDEIDRNVELRMHRQKLLARRTPAAPRLSVVIDESVLRRPISDRAGMRDQLLHLASVSETANVTLQLLPLEAGPHAASMAGSFVILDFATEGGRDAEPTTVYSDNLAGALYLDKPAEVAKYVSAWGALERLALSPADSRELLKSMHEEM